MELILKKPEKKLERGSVFDKNGPGWCRARNKGLAFYNIRRCRALWASDNIESHCFALSQGFKTVALNG
jgi:hypothetical protein